MALRCRERAPSTTSNPASRAAKKIGRPPPQGQTYSPNFGRLSMKRLGGMTDAAAGDYCRSARRSPGKGNEKCDLKPFKAIQRVRLPPGKGKPASRKRALQGWWQHHS